MLDPKEFSILNKINSPKDIKKLSIKELNDLSKELREFIIKSVAVTGGHLGANLGVVELTVALYKVFNPLKDKIIWDIGHQSYPHKILTGRKDMFDKLRKKGGISGFCNIFESEYDHFGAGHSSTSISASLGMSIGESIQGQSNNIIAVIGDASISSGMALEAMNHAGNHKANLTVILNDNNKSILDSVGALNSYFSKITSSYSYSFIREHSKKILKSIPFGMGKIITDMEKYIRNISHNGFFEALGFFYIGPIDGHNLHSMLPIINNLKNNRYLSKPILLHVVTQKGKGYSYAEKAKDNYHGVSTFDTNTGKSLPNSKASPPTHSKIIGNVFIKMAKAGKQFVAISCGTLGGVGMEEFSEMFPDKVFDVGIAEQHAVTFAAGLAKSGITPYIFLYSTFAQRAYDQIVHDVCLQRLPVRFILDRSGFVGEDGATHHGLLNHSMFLPLPEVSFMTPAYAEDIEPMINLMHDLSKHPSFLSVPKGAPINKPSDGLKGVKYSQGEIVQQGKDIAVIAVGPMLKEALVANSYLQKENIFVTIVDPKFLKPIDSKLFKEIFENHKAVLVVEEGYSGGFFNVIYDFFQKNYIMKRNVLIEGIHVQNKYFEQASRAEQIINAKIDGKSIYKKVKSYFDLLNNKF